MFHFFFLWHACIEDYTYKNMSNKNRKLDRFLLNYSYINVEIRETDRMKRQMSMFGNWHYSLSISPEKCLCDVASGGNINQTGLNVFFYFENICISGTFLKYFCYYFLEMTSIFHFL